MATKTDTEEPSRPSTPLNDEEESDDEEDNVQVTIREVKAPTIAPAVKAYKMKQGQQKQIDIDEIPSVNGYPLIEIELDNFEEKPWKMPGADISDYFNYGFDEDSWRGYCDKQKRLRAETQTRASYIFPPNRVVNDTRHQPQVIQTITRLDNFSHEQANLLGDNQLPGVGNDGENADELQDSKKRSYPSMDMLPPGMPPFGMPPMPFSLPPGMMPPAFPPLPGMVPGIPSFDPFLDEGRERDERKRRDRDRDRDYDRDYDRYDDRRRRDRSEERERKHKRKYRDEDDDDRSHKHKRSRKHRRSRSRSVEREHTPVNDE